MKWANFEIPREGWSELAELGGFVEAFVHTDPCFEKPAPNLREPTQ